MGIWRLIHMELVVKMKIWKNLRMRSMLNYLEKRNTVKCRKYYLGAIKI